MDYILDTNIWVHIIRKTPSVLSVLEEKGVFSAENNIFMSIVTAGELYTLASRNRWGQGKLDELENIIEEIQTVPISRMDLVKKYAEIDIFSQGFHPIIALPNGLSARNMGKNDLWIAATAALLGATLITLDNDFNHLSSIFIEIDNFNSIL
jgi:tRNA(fMet)-specific endonuclease VapC